MYRVRDFEEERSRTLYVRLPHRIRDPKEVQELFIGEAKVKLPRQASRACHVIFPKIEDKVEGMKSLKGKTINGKRVIVLNPKTKPMENRIKRKKIIIPEPDPTSKITLSLFVANINARTTMEDLKEAFPGSVSVSMRKLNTEGVRHAFVKMESIQLAGEYIRNKKEPPVIHGNKLFVGEDTRKQKSGRGSKNEKLKIYDKDGKETINKFENLNEKNIAGTNETTSDSEED